GYDGAVWITKGIRKNYRSFGDGRETKAQHDKRGINRFCQMHMSALKANGPRVCHKTVQSKRNLSPWFGCVNCQKRHGQDRAPHDWNFNQRLASSIACNAETVVISTGNFCMLKSDATTDCRKRPNVSAP